MSTTVETVRKDREIVWQEKIISDTSLLDRYARPWMSVVLGISDLVSLILAGVVAACLHAALGYGFLKPEQYVRMLPLLAVFLGLYAWRGLYPAVGLSPVEELHRLTVSTSAGFLLISGLTFWTRSAEGYSRLVIAFAWLFALVLVQANRWFVRILAIKLQIWGEPVAVIGYGPQSYHVVDFLQKHAHFGFRPVIILDGLEVYKNQPALLSKISPGESEIVNNKLNVRGIQTVILIASEVPLDMQEAIFNNRLFSFRHVIMISNPQGIGSIGVTPYDLDGLPGFEVRQNLLNAWGNSIKRIMDILLVLSGSPFILPVVGLISLLIRLDSPGGIFYAQVRHGRRGRKFKVWKFRTMIPDADRVLEAYLSENPEARREWEALHKIKNDPRITRIGCILRKTSLDELPQVWNVLAGEMSLVGPRPIVSKEIEYYHESYQLYMQVRPGLSGLWQVSGRNDIGYEDRVRLDEYYVRNWSIWLDIYILLRTVYVVLKRDGAY